MNAARLFHLGKTLRVKTPHWPRTALVLTLASVLWLGCTHSGQDAPGPRPGTLRVGLTPNYAPVVFRDENGLAGIEVDFARAAAAALGLEPVFVEREWDALIPSLATGEIDVIMSGMSITPARRERVLFTEPYLRVGQLALIRRSDIGRFGAPERIRRRGVRVGFVRDTTGQKFVREQLRKSIAYAFDSVDEGVRNLRSGRVDYFVHDSPTIWRVANRPGETDLMGLYHPLTKEDLAWAVRPDDMALKQRLDAVLETWRTTNQLDPVLNRWIPVRVKVGN
jgi:ABC-type amino acid transport substrate-binding protein